MQKMLNRIENLVKRIENIDKIERYRMDDISDYYMIRLQLKRVKPLLERLDALMKLESVSKRLKADSFEKDIDKVVYHIDRILNPQPFDKPGISDSDIQEAKHHDIIALAESLGIQMNRGFIKCPFHDEDTASCKLYPGTNSFYCFGCGEGGDVITFIMKVKRLNFVEAVIELIK